MHFAFQILNTEENIFCSSKIIHARTTTLFPLFSHVEAVNFQKYFGSCIAYGKDGKLQLNQLFLQFEVRPRVYQFCSKSQYQ